MTQFTVTKKLMCDPGHGWASVKLSELVELGIVDKISSYSYINGKSVYLEEDCDLGVYCRAIEAKGGKVKFDVRHSDNRSPIRSYNRFASGSIQK
jgi:hypothetical protein